MKKIAQILIPIVLLSLAACTRRQEPTMDDYHKAEHFCTNNGMVVDYRYGELVCRKENVFVRVRPENLH